MQWKILVKKLFCNAVKMNCRIWDSEWEFFSRLQNKHFSRYLFSFCKSQKKTFGWRLEKQNLKERIIIQNLKRKVRKDLVILWKMRNFDLFSLFSSFSSLLNFRIFSWFYWVGEDFLSNHCLSTWSLEELFPVRENRGSYFSAPSFLQGTQKYESWNHFDKK